MNIQGLLNTNVLQPEKPQKLAQSGDFSALLKHYVSDINHTSKAASKAAEKLAVTGVGSPAETMIALKKAGLSFQLLVAARGKVVDAYREVMRMQI
ncbi:MAG: flagellar hook-basal body complex protein FliE [Mariprofundaceae bacterium]|nr:flagellar hook-basal body complex protein FliE [Mariprofundaceae bacterium]